MAMRHSFLGLSAAASRALWSSTMIFALTAAGCAKSGNGTSSGGGGGGGADPTTTSSSSTGTGGEGGNPFPCGQDCSKIEAPQCLVAVCNMGEYPGTVGACTVVYSPEGTGCDDGLFCTVGDACDGKGQCKGGEQNDCGMTAPDCKQMACNEASKSCAPAPAPDDTQCTPTNKCQVNGLCKSGTCVGGPKDCSFSPLSECNTVACNPATGACEGTPNAAKDGDKCTLSGDFCMQNRTCQAGQCVGDTPKDCSALTVGCTSGVCDPANGACVAEPVPAGGACFDGIDECHTGMCDASAKCVAAAVPDGTVCNDHNACTTGDVCTAGVCGGAATTGCQVYFIEGFETCNWTLGGDWQCGTPTNEGPTAAHGGSHVIATQLAGDYHDDQEYDIATATSPTISLAGATSPVLSFWAWVHTEGSTYDGFNLKVSGNNSPFTEVTAVTPAYPLEIDGEDAWGGDLSTMGWQNYLADLSAYAGQDVKLRFAFRTDGSGTRPGVYIDDLLVAEPSAIPIEISTAVLPDAVVGKPYVTTFARTGGSTSATWSIVSGTNHGWVTLDPATGALGGTPMATDLGPVSVTVKIEEPSVPGNFAEKTYNFNVIDVPYYEPFEGPCPNGWTLAGDWQCGQPTAGGPSAAFNGSQCIATQIAGNYNDDQAWATTVATSPAIDLTGTATTAPKLSFRLWVDTESVDGANLKISANGGAFNLVTNVSPAYDQSSAGGQPAWGGHLSDQGWRLVTVDLSAYVGQSIQLRFGFRSDGSATYPGVYIDDILITSN
ncbi:Neutral protease [Minicystis rosea]|nr:Neutral protease [Minicystis rosea]